MIGLTTSDGPWLPVPSGPGISVRRRDGALHIELNRPEVHNAFDFDMTVAMSEAVQIAGEDDSVRAVLISGRGPSFSSGADLKSAFDVQTRSQVGEHLRRYTAPMILAIRAMHKPVVAAVHGNAVGAGCSLAVACDYVVAADSASFHLAFSRVGLGIDGGASATVSARAGFSVASAMALLGKPMDAATALRCGLAERVVPDAELAEVTQGLLHRFAAGPTGSYAATKSVLNAFHFGQLSTILALEADAQEALLASADFAEALAALAEQRAPLFGRLHDGP